MKKKSTEQFIAEAKLIHPQYDYSLVEYVNSKTKVKVICPIHGEFEITPNHLNDQKGCLMCVRESQKKSTEQFIAEAKLIHPQYDYSLVEYVNNKTKVKVICPVHGEFEVVPSNLLQGHGCRKCATEGSKKNYTKPQEQFIAEATKAFPEYNYFESIYVNAKTKVKVVCPTHGEFFIKPNDLLNRRGCKKCADFKKTKTQEQFLIDVKKVFPEYDYSSSVYVNKRTKVSVNCPVHGEFFIKPNDLLMGHGCPKCCSSKGERSIREYLQENSIQYVEQYKIPDCRNKNPLPFDFAVFENNTLQCLIEFQGEQHFRPVNVFGGEDGFIYRKKNDVIKKEYCDANAIPLLEIHFEEEIQKTLEEFLRKNTKNPIPTEIGN